MSVTAILARLVFAGPELRPIRNGCVVVEGDRIVAVGPRSSLAKRALDGSTIDLGDASLLPGFINLHVHLDFDGSPDFLNAAKLIDEQTSTLLAVDSAARSLAAGVTTVRDLGNKYAVAISLREASNRGWIRAPRIIAAGKAICMTGGHGWFIGLESDGPHDMRKAVRQNLKLGADCIKVIATGGVLSPGVEVGSAQLDEDELVVAVREAHKAGRRVAAHAIANVGIKNALRAGVDTIEHGCYLDGEAVDMMKKRGAWYVPTLRAPQAMYGLEGLAPYVVRKVNQVYDAHRESFKLALKKGVNIATGTDAGTPFNAHGDYAIEMRLMTELGMTTERALRAGTVDAADALGIKGEIGEITAGACADLVAVDGDPLRDIGATRRVRAVVSRGRMSTA
jgi:imidazolonepropionase-like amidohydrolase